MDIPSVRFQPVPEQAQAAITSTQGHPRLIWPVRPKFNTCTGGKHKMQTLTMQQTISCVTRQVSWVIQSKFKLQSSTMFLFTQSPPDGNYNSLEVRWACRRKFNHQTFKALPLLNLLIYFISREAICGKCLKCLTIQYWLLLPMRIQYGIIFFSLVSVYVSFSLSTTRNNNGEVSVQSLLTNRSRE